MAKIIISIEDTDIGHPRITSSPDMKILLQVGKDKKNRTPAEGYAIVALAAMVEFSGTVTKEIAGLEGISRTRLH